MPPRVWGHTREPRGKETQQFDDIDDIEDADNVAVGGNE